MKLSRQQQRPRRQAGWTLVETTITASLLVLIMAGMLGVHIGGLRMYEITRAKLGASDDARRALNLLITEVKEAKIVRIGSGGLGSFTEVSSDAPQLGSAIQIYATTNTNTFVRYFWNSTSRQLERTTNGSSSATVVAHAITNSLVFRAENAQGVVLTNNQNNRVIALQLQFNQLISPSVQIGPGQLFDFYQIRSKITRRALE
jgi:hypothetical protein